MTKKKSPPATPAKAQTEYREFNTADESSQMVTDLVKEFKDLVMKKTEGLHPRAKWLIMARAVNSLFGAHYAVGLFHAENEMHRASESHRKAADDDEGETCLT